MQSNTVPCPFNSTLPGGICFDSGEEGLLWMFLIIGMHSGGYAVIAIDWIHPFLNVNRV